MNKIKQYTVFARKWRPKVFNEVIGQEHILKSLMYYLSENKIHQAYLFSGIRGTGKTTIARIFAKGLNCITGITYYPCNKCIICREIKNNCFIDLIEVDAASKTKVDDIMELLDNIKYPPSIGRYKIFIIDEIHMLSKYSFNALLKALEEPPMYIKFLFATTEINRIPNTIISRCINFNLRPLKNIQIYNKLVNILNIEKIKSDNNALNLIAQASRGSMRDALNLSDQAISIGQGKLNFDSVKIILNYIDENTIIDILEALIKNKKNIVFKYLKKYEESNIDWEKLLINMLNILNNISIKKNISIKYWNLEDSIYTKRLLRISKKISSKKIQYYYKIILKGIKDLPYAPNYKIGVEMTFLNILILDS